MSYFNYKRITLDTFEKCETVQHKMYFDRIFKISEEMEIIVRYGAFNNGGVYMVLVNHGKKNYSDLMNSESVIKGLRQAIATANTYLQNYRQGLL